MTKTKEWTCVEDIPEQEKLYLFTIGAANLAKEDGIEINVQPLDEHCWKLIEMLNQAGYEPTQEEVARAATLLTYGVGDEH